MSGPTCVALVSLLSSTDVAWLKIVSLYCFVVGASSLRNRRIILAIAVGEENVLFGKKFVFLIVHE